MLQKRQWKRIWQYPSKSDQSSLHRVPLLLRPLPTNPTYPILPQPLGLKARQLVSAPKMRPFSKTSGPQCQIITVVREVQRIIQRMLLSRPPPPLLIQNATRSKKEPLRPQKISTPQTRTTIQIIAVTTACLSATSSSNSSPSTAQAKADKAPTIHDLLFLFIITNLPSSTSSHR